MKPTSFDAQNFTFTKPEGWTDDQCKDLPVFRGYTPEGLEVIISKWALEPSEIEEINRTGAIYLWIHAAFQPPVQLQTENPFTAGKAQENLGASLTVSINLEITKDQTYITINGGDAPKSLILEALSNFTQQLADELVKEALEVVPAEGLEGYMTGRLKEDRKKVNNKLSGKIITLR